jgi:S-adenosylmethionine synthetase
MVPLEYYFARSICNHIYKKFPYDGKVQVTLSCEEDEFSNSIIIASFQNVDSVTLTEIVKEWVDKNSKKFFTSFKYSIYANTAGDWNKGGFDADTGLSGRKIVIDNYGPEIPIGGGSFSGKDYTKVDRSGAYIARKIAVDLLKKHNAKKVYTKLAYAIGKAEPVMAVAKVDGVDMPIRGYDLTPKGIYIFLKLDKVKFSETSNWGHFGRGFTWD